MGREQRVLGTVAAVVLTHLVSGCGGGGDVEFESSASVAVRVVWPDAESVIDPGGGMVVLGSGCLDHDVDVLYPDGRVVTLEGPICPDQVVAIDDDAAELRPQNGGGS
jgi:hypothetical protein